MIKHFILVVIVLAISATAAWFIPPQSIPDGQTVLEYQVKTALLVVTAVLYLAVAFYALIAVRQGGSLFEVWKSMAYGFVLLGLSHLQLPLFQITGWQNTYVQVGLVSLLFFSSAVILLDGIDKFISHVIGKKSFFTAGTTLFGVIVLGVIFTYVTEQRPDHFYQLLIVTETTLIHILCFFALLSVYRSVGGIFAKPFKYLTIGLGLYTAFLIPNPYLQVYMSGWERFLYTNPGIPTYINIIAGFVLLYAVVALKGAFKKSIE
jgi:hypothetical protein